MKTIIGFAFLVILIMVTTFYELLPAWAIGLSILFFAITAIAAWRLRRGGPPL